MDRRQDATSGVLPPTTSDRMAARGTANRRPAAQRAPIHVRSLRDEAEWLPSSLDDLAELIALADQRYRRPEMAGLVDWLVRKVMGWPDPTSSATRAKYRKMLRELGPELEPWMGETEPESA